MNKSIMMGRLVRDPEINYTTKKDGDEFVVANFRIAVDRKYSDESIFWLYRCVDKLFLRCGRVYVIRSWKDEKTQNLY